MDLSEKIVLEPSESTKEHLLKLDKNGVPLSPQPSDDPKDPLNWQMTFKIFVLLQVSVLAALGTLNTAIINPAYVPMARDFGISTITASYQTTVVIALNGIGPFIWIPLANVYGRRPIYLLTTGIGFVSAIGSGFSGTFGTLLVARVFNGFFPVAMSMGAGTVTDIFFMQQRGRAMGVFTVFSTTGAHIAPILGGLAGEFAGWQWCFFLAAILDGVMLVIIFFCLPETFYIRTHGETSSKPEHYTMAYGFGSILPAVTVAQIFTEHFHFGTLAIGLAYGGALTVGGVLGEFGGGMVVDYIMNRERRLRGKDVEPEVRLKAIWTGEFLVPIGLLVYGFGIQYKVHFMIPIVAMGIATAGVQVITTVVYTYAIECYHSEASEISQLMNLIRQEFGFTFAFYAIRLGDAIGYQFTFLIFALLGNGVAFVPIIWLMLRGQRVRERLGKPESLQLFGYMEENSVTRVD